MNVDDGIEFAQPTSEDERAEVAQACMLRTHFEMPMLLDDMTNQVEEAYRALPDRLYVVGANGLVAWRGEQGPFGFDVDAFSREIAREIETS